MSTVGLPPLREVVERSFRATHAGRSVDDVVIEDALNAAFITACLQELPNASPAALNWELLNFRKLFPGIGRVTTVRRRDRHDKYIHASEIAARHMEDSHGLTIDRVLCDPNLRARFDVIARGIAPDVSTYLLRKAALKLRKNRRLKPELLKRVADWGKRVLTYPAERLLQNPDLIPRLPGVYIFWDCTGYLYIGEGANLRGRVQKQLDHSDRKAIAHYLWENGHKNLTVELHAFRKDSGGARAACRKAYEAELIGSRKPRLNIQGA
jgi:hypothetical protein